MSDTVAILIRWLHAVTASVCIIAFSHKPLGVAFIKPPLQACPILGVHCLPPHNVTSTPNFLSGISARMSHGIKDLNHKVIVQDLGLAYATEFTNST